MNMPVKRKPMYLVIADDIKDTIDSNKFDYNNPICTERSICEQYNVSRITAKHAINKLEEKGILYRKRGIGSFVTKLAPQLQRVFALVVPFSTTQGGIFRAVNIASNVLSKQNHQLTIHMAHTDAADNVELLEQLDSQNVDGIVYYPRTSVLPLETLNSFVNKSHPVIILDKKIPYPEFTSIVCDNYKGGYLLAEHLISYGHTRICYLSRFALNHLPSIDDRYNGYKDCLIDAGITIPARFIHWSDYSSQSGQAGYYMLQHIVNTLCLDGITAIICENDEVAFNVHMCCLNLGLRIPDDISIAGFDNTDWATTGNAQITTIDQNFGLIGEAIASALLDEKVKPQHHIIPVMLIPRTSTGRAKE